GTRGDFLARGHLYRWIVLQREVDGRLDSKRLRRLSRLLSGSGNRAEQQARRAPEGRGPLHHSIATTHQSSSNISPNNSRTLARDAASTRRPAGVARYTRRILLPFFRAVDRRYPFASSPCRIG